MFTFFIAVEQIDMVLVKLPYCYSLVSGMLGLCLFFGKTVGVWISDMVSRRSSCKARSDLVGCVVQERGCDLNNEASYREFLE